MTLKRALADVHVRFRLDEMSESEQMDLCRQLRKAMLETDGFYEWGDPRDPETQRRQQAKKEATE